MKGKDPGKETPDKVSAITLTPSISQEHGKQYERCLEKDIQNYPTESR